MSASTLIPPSRQVQAPPSDTPSSDVEACSDDPTSTIVFDSGRGWLVVLGSAMALFSTTGIINAYVRLPRFYVVLFSPLSSVVGVLSSILHHYSFIQFIFDSYLTYRRIANIPGLWRWTCYGYIIRCPWPARE